MSRKPSLKSIGIDPKKIIQKATKNKDKEDERSEAPKPSKSSKNEVPTLMDFVVRDILKELNHPTKLQYVNLNRTYSMQEVVKYIIEHLIKSIDFKLSTNKDIDEETKLFLENKNFRIFNLLPRYFAISEKYSQEIRMESKDLIEVWDTIEKRTHDKEMLKIYGSMKTYVEFLADRGKFELLREFQDHVNNQGYKIENS